MKNFKVISKEDEKEYWISRSAVMTAVFATINNKICVLANKRGFGTPDYQDYWNCQCGYLDWNETTKRAAQREVYEETGYKIHDIAIHKKMILKKMIIKILYFSFSILKDVTSPDQ